MKRRDGNKKFPRRAYEPIPYCSPRGLPQPVKLIPIKTWCEQNRFSLAQARRFLRTRDLLGLSFKGKMFVVPNPESARLG